MDGEAKGYSCIECSEDFTGPCGKASSILPEYLIQEGVAICPLCSEFGPGDVGCPRRDWKVHERVRVSGCPWTGPNAWTRSSKRLGMYIFIRGWQNTVMAKVNSGFTDIPIAYNSVSLKERTLGWISKVEGDVFTVSRYPSDEESGLHKKAGRKIKMIGREMRFCDLWPPESLKDTRLAIPKKCNGPCGVIHTELRLGSELGWGCHPKYGGHNLFCSSCIPPRAIPESAGDHQHIGFCKPFYCGCWSCSASDNDHDVSHVCTGCEKSSSSGWIDRKSGDSKWYCRVCWIEYYRIHKLVRISDVEKGLFKDPYFTTEETTPSVFNGIWVLKDESLDAIPKDKVERVKRFLKNDYGLEPFMYFPMTIFPEADCPDIVKSQGQPKTLDEVEWPAL